MRQEIMLEDKAQKCVALARSQRAKLAVAESCSGGLIGAALSAIPGASDVFLGGVIAYDNVVKTEVLRIDPALLQAHGAVSVPVARAMAKGAQDLLKADFAVAVTGIAGPSGDSSNKPVGLVHIAACGLEYICLDQECRFGDIGRDAVRQGAVCAAIELLCAALESAAAG